MEDQIKLQVGVKILIKNDEGKFLLLKRSLGKYPEAKGRWDLVGGRINPGTSLMENLQREVKEETGLELIGNPELVAAQDIMRKDFHVVRLTYSGTAKGNIELDKEENDMYKWYSMEELLVLDDIDEYFEDLLAKNSFKI